MISQGEIEYQIKKIIQYIINNIRYDRKDAIFPADPRIFNSNPLNVFNGAWGIIYSLNKLRVDIPSKLLFKVLNYNINSSKYTSGLYVGTSGIAWVLLELSLKEETERIMNIGENHKLMFDSPGIFFGASGYGLTCLKFYLKTSDVEWLKKAKKIGERLMESAIKVDDNKYCWKHIDGDTHLGYGEGATGISLFLLYLSIISGEYKYLEVGTKALEFDISYLKTSEEGILGMQRGVAGNVEKVITSYWDEGTAGGLTSVLRYWKGTKNDKYLILAKSLIKDVSRKYAAFPGLFMGLSGLGNALIDAYQFIGDKEYLKEAYKVATGVSLFAINENNGISYPGEQLFRKSTDFGTGSSGIALFYNRLLNAETKYNNFNFVLDEVFKE